MNASEALTRLNHLLDEMDVICGHGVSSIENKLISTRDALSRAQTFKTDNVSAQADASREALEQEISGYRERLQEMEALLADAEQRTQSSSQQMQDISGALQNRSEQVDLLTSENEELKGRLAALNDADKIRQALEEDVLGLRQELEDRDALLEGLQGELREAGEKAGQIEELQRKIQELESLRGDLSEREERLESLQQQVRQFEEEVGGLRERAESAERALRERDDHVARLEQSLAGAETMAREAEAALESSQAETLERNNDLQEVKAAYDKAVGELAALQADSQPRVDELEAVKLERESLASELAALQADSQSRVDELAAVKLERESLASELAALQAESQSRVDELAAVKLDRESLAGELDILRMDHQAMSDELEEHKSLLSQTKETAASLAAEKAQLEQARAEFQENQQGQDKIRMMLQQKDMEVSTMESALADADEQRSKLELQIKMLMGQIEGLQYQQDELESLKGQVSRLEASLAEERAQVVRLKAQIAMPSSPPRSAINDADFAENLAPAVKEVKKAPFENEKGRSGQRRRMGEILVEAGVITPDQLEEVLLLKAKDPRRRIGVILTDLRYATEEVIFAALAAQLRMRFVEDVAREMEPGISQYIPAHLARNHRCVPLSMNAGILTVAMANPMDLIAIEDIEIASNAQVESVVSTPSQIDTAISRLYAMESSMASQR